MSKELDKPELVISFDPASEKSLSVVWQKLAEEVICWGQPRAFKMEEYQKEIMKIVSKHKGGLKLMLRPRRNGKAFIAKSDKDESWRNIFPSVGKINLMAAEALEATKPMAIIFDEFNWDGVLRVKPIVKAVSDSQHDIDRGDDSK